MTYNYEKLGDPEKQAAVNTNVIQEPASPSDHAVTATIEMQPWIVFDLFLLYFICTVVHAFNITYLARTFFEGCANVRISDPGVMILAILIQLFTLLPWAESEFGYDRRIWVAWSAEWVWNREWPSIWLAGFGLAVVLTVMGVKMIDAVINFMFG